MLSYIHKFKDGRDINLFANSSDTAVDTEVVLRGRMTLERWDPHTGKITPLETTALTEKGATLTKATRIGGAAQSACGGHGHLRVVACQRH